MTEPDQQPDPEAAFDVFYKQARDRLLVQAYALTGDLGAARSAVRDAFVVAWHHWPKVSRLEDPETSVRPAASRQALRRANARPFHREKNLDPGIRETLDALAALPVAQRRMLVLTQLAGVPMPDAAREVGLPVEEAGRTLQTAASQFSLQRDVPSPSAPMVLAELAEATDRVTWPRVTIIRRAGAARRRAHTLVGTLAVVATLVVSGTVVTDATGARPTLHRAPQPSASDGVTAAAPEIRLPDTSLLPDTAVRERIVGPWAEARTHDNSTGTGAVLPCQPGGPRSRYADPDGAAAWVREFRNGPRGEATRRLTQVAEASRRPRAASAAYHRVRRWVAGCRMAGTRLVSTAVPPGTGDESAVFVLRADLPQEATYVVGVARTGLFTTAVALETDVAPALADRDGVARLLGDAVDRLCSLADGGACATEPVPLADAPAFPTGEVPALLSPLDLPQIGQPDQPWAGTPPREITGERTDLDLLGCQTPPFASGRFEGRPFSTALVRTFLKLDSDLPPEFGLTQAVATLPGASAATYVEAVRTGVMRCPEVDAGAGTEVEVLEQYDEGDRGFTAWHLTTRVTGDRTVAYDVAIVRDGTALSLLVFVSAPELGVGREDFVALTRRALERLPQLTTRRG